MHAEAARSEPVEGLCFPVTTLSRGTGLMWPGEKLARHLQRQKPLLHQQLYNPHPEHLLKRLGTQSRRHPDTRSRSCGNGAGQAPNIPPFFDIHLLVGDLSRRSHRKVRRRILQSSFSSSRLFRPQVRLWRKVDPQHLRQAENVLTACPA